jgi:hypothetical protein
MTTPYNWPVVGKIREFFRESVENDPANGGCAILLAAFVVLALIVVLAQATDGWLFASALIVFPLWFFIRRQLS